MKRLHHAVEQARQVVPPREAVQREHAVHEARVVGATLRETMLEANERLSLDDRGMCVDVLLAAGVAT
jgi:hypothetical protein